MVIKEERNTGSYMTRPVFASTFLKMQGTADSNIWEYAKTENFIPLSKDNDFRQRSFLFGFPPKVIWLPVGNGGTKVLANLILKNSKQIITFANSSTEGLLVLN